MSGPRSISVVTPVYNEAAIVEDAIARIDAFLKTHFEDYEIVIIESGSTDGTAAITDRLTAGNARIRVVHEGARNGFGAAVRLGHAHSTKDLIWLVTADLTFPLDAVLGALPLLADHDCVLSYRSKDNRKSAYRRLQSVAYNALVRIVLGLRVRHVNSAFKLLKRDVIRRLPPLTSTGWFIDTEIVYRLTHAGVRYAEIPVELIERTGGRSSITVWTAFAMLGELLRFVSAERRRGRFRRR